MKLLFPSLFPSFFALVLVTTIGIGITACGSTTQTGAGESPPLLDDGGTTDNTGTGMDQKIVLTCPRNVTAGAAISEGFKVTLTDSAGAVLRDRFVGISPVRGGQVFAPPEAEEATFGGNTDTRGVLLFSYRAEPTARADTKVTLTASAKDGETTTATASCIVNIKIASLTFTDPNNGTSAMVCEPIRLRVSSLASDGVTPVAGNVNLSATNGAILSFDQDGCTGSSSLRSVGVDGNTGDFFAPVFVKGVRSGSTTVEAVDVNASTRKTAVSLQFTDQPTSATLEVSPQNIQTINSTTGGTNRSQLRFTVFGSSGQGMAGQTVVFTLERMAGGDFEQLRPATANTSTTGIASAEYRSGTGEGTAVIRACVQGTSICDSQPVFVKK